jgi:septal ring factor EnvC (AmiA/AmiB activator)
MSTILERYLFLLEDPKFDELEELYKNKRKKIKELGAEADKLAAEHPDLSKAPEHVKQKLNAYRKEVDEFAKISERRKKYTAWTRGGRRTGFNPESSWGFGRRAEEQASRSNWESGAGRWNTGGTNWEETVRKASSNYQKQIRNEALIQVGVYLALIFAYLGFAIYEAMSRAKKNCGHISDPVKREICLIKYKIKILENQINALKKRMNGCNKTKDPKKCKMKITEKINKIDTKLKVAKNKLKYLENFLMQQAKEKRKRG